MTKPPTGETLRLLLRAGHPDGRSALIAALRDNGGDVQRTAAAVGLVRRTLYRLAPEILTEHGAGKRGSGLASAAKRAAKAKEKRAVTKKAKRATK